MKSRLKAPSPASVISLIALFVALGGTAYAAATLPPNSVGTRQLKLSAVTGAKIRSNAVTSTKVMNDSLTGADINEASLSKVPSAAHADVATNAAGLGGLPASDYMYAQGGQAGGDPFSALGGSSTALGVGLGFSPVGYVKMDCPDPATSLTVRYTNTSAALERVWIEPSGGSATLNSLAASATTSASGAAHVTYFIEVSGTTMVRTDVWTGLDAGTNSCFGYVDSLVLPFTQ